MPIVEHMPLPTFERLRQQGEQVLSLDQALTQDIRELHIGLLNMMPDAALQVTEQQFLRLVGSCNQIVQFYVHPFTVQGLPRSKEAQDYINTYYSTFDDIRNHGLDALIITGANVANPSLEQEPFWDTLTEVMNWATEHVTSVLCSCLATHSLLKYLYQIDRVKLPQKKWGVYSHRLTYPQHPILRDINTRFDVPHSRNNTITRQQFEAAGLRILIESEDGEVHMAVSPDLFRHIYLQGHPEYYRNSLLKEYKREVMLYLDDQRDLPPYPEYYFPKAARRIAEEYIAIANRAKGAGDPLPPFPEDDLLPHIENTWNDTGKAIFNNWLGLVYKLTNIDPHQLFIDGVDPQNPLGML